jgi:hypothetical protein
LRPRVALATEPAAGEPAQQNIERLKLAVDHILPLHGRKVPLAEFHKWTGKSSKGSSPRMRWGFWGL